VSNDTLTCRRCGQPIELRPDADPNARPAYHDPDVTLGHPDCWGDLLQANRDASFRRMADGTPGSGPFCA
jgi:hypothetical protein